MENVITYVRARIKTEQRRLQYLSVVFSLNHLEAKSYVKLPRKMLKTIFKPHIHSATFRQSAVKAKAPFRNQKEVINRISD